MCWEAWRKLSWSHAHSRVEKLILVSFYLLCSQTSSLRNFFTIIQIYSICFPLCFLYRCFLQFAFYHFFFFQKQFIYDFRLTYDTRWAVFIQDVSSLMSSVLLHIHPILHAVRCCPLSMTGQGWAVPFNECPTILYDAASHKSKEKKKNQHTGSLIFKASLNAFVASPILFSFPAVTCWFNKPTLSAEQIMAALKK